MSKSTKISALKENEGVEQPEIINKSLLHSIKFKRNKELDVTQFIQDILKGQIPSLSRAITLIESTQPKHFEIAQQIIEGCLPYANNSIRIGITGVPGVGKSTFIEAFGKYLTSLGKKVAVLAIDPSSSISHGSILGDKTRMEELVKDENAYIRPSASGESLGGVARKTRESIILCEAAGFDTILIETVGVGQSETAVHSMVDYFLLLKLSGAGDELQGIKRGIMEMADGIVINKADGDNIKKANLAKVEFNRALHLFPEKKSHWQPKVSTCSALTKEGISEIWNNIQTYVSHTKENGYFNYNREQQNQYWMYETINDTLKNNFFNHPEVEKNMVRITQMVTLHQITPFQGAMELLSLVKK